MTSSLVSESRLFTNFDRAFLSEALKPRAPQMGPLEASSPIPVESSSPPLHLSIRLFQASGVDKGKRILVDAWEDSPRLKKVTSPVDFSFVSTNESSPVQGSLSLVDEDDVVLADLKLQRKKLNIKKHKVLTEMQNELLVLLQSADSDFVANSEDAKWAEAAELSLLSPAP